MCNCSIATPWSVWRGCWSETNPQDSLWKYRLHYVSMGDSRLMLFRGQEVIPSATMRHVSWEEKTIGKIPGTIRRYHSSWDWWNLWQCLFFLDCRNSQSRTRQINRGFGSRTCRVGKKPFPWRQVLFSVCKSCCFGWRITHGGRKRWWYYSSCWKDQLSVVVIIVGLAGCSNSKFNFFLPWLSGWYVIIFKFLFHNVFHIINLLCLVFWPFFLVRIISFKFKFFILTRKLSLQDH